MAAVKLDFYTDCRCFGGIGAIFHADDHYVTLYGMADDRDLAGPCRAGLGQQQRDGYHREDRGGGKSSSKNGSGHHHFPLENSRLALDPCPAKQHYGRTPRALHSDVRKGAYVAQWISGPFEIVNFLKPTAFTAL